MHFGHSCLVPVDQSSVKTMYVHVEIAIDDEHLADTIMKNFFDGVDDKERRPIYMLGTVQFVKSIDIVARKFGPSIVKYPIPREKPLSGGEVLGCTAPQLPLTEAERSGEPGTAGRVVFV